MQGATRAGSHQCPPINAPISVCLMYGYLPWDPYFVHTWDPYFVTPNIKALLRNRNKLMRRNKIEAANAITARIGRMISKTNSTTFAKPNMTTKELWETVKTVSGADKNKQCNSVPTITADSLNSHYASI